MRKTVLVTLTALLLGAAASLPASAMVQPFGGAANGTDPLGDLWRTTNVSGKGAWGEPGLGRGTLTFNPVNDKVLTGHSWANEFDFIFLEGVAGVIDTGAVTRFVDVTKGITFTPLFISPKEVHFLAPAGMEIDRGDKYFVNVGFTGKVDTRRFSFAGLWTEKVAMPEPVSMALLGTGLVALGLLRRRR